MSIKLVYNISDNAGMVTALVCRDLYSFYFSVCFRFRLWGGGGVSCAFANECFFSGPRLSGGQGRY